MKSCEKCEHEMICYHVHNMYEMCNGFTPDMDKMLSLVNKLRKVFASECLYYENKE